MIFKTNKTIGLLRKLQHLPSRVALKTNYKAFVRSFLDCGDVIFVPALNGLFHKKSESIKYIACLVLSGTIRGTTEDKLY